MDAAIRTAWFSLGEAHGLCPPVGLGALMARVMLPNPGADFAAD